MRLSDLDAELLEDVARESLLNAVSSRPPPHLSHQHILREAMPRPVTDRREKARLKDLVHGPIDLMLMTHPHADHIGGMEAALHPVGARLFMEPGYDHPSPGARSRATGYPAIAGSSAPPWPKVARMTSDDSVKPLLVRAAW